MASNPSLKLYSSPISDASARVRISLALKKLSYQTVPLNVSKLATHSPPELARLNPAQTVPTLVVHSPGQRPTDTEPVLVLSQSNAILEYLEEAYPDSTALLPPLSRPEARAKVRALVDIIATDIHPLKVHRVTREIHQQFPCPESEAALADDNKQWCNHWARRGLRLYEYLSSQTSGLYSFGDTVTLADVYLMPEVWTATKMGVDLSEFPLVSRIYENLSKVPEIQQEQHKPELGGL